MTGEIIHPKKYEGPCFSRMPSGYCGAAGIVGESVICTASPENILSCYVIMKEDISKKV